MPEEQWGQSPQGTPAMSQDRSRPTSLRHRIPGIPGVALPCFALCSAPSACGLLPEVWAHCGQGGHEQDAEVGAL